MARDSGGTYALAAGTNATFGERPLASSKWNGAFNDLATEMTDSVSRSGKGSMLADFKTGGFRLLDLNLGTAASPSIHPVGSINTGIYFPSVADFAISISGTQRALVTATGINATAIGATTPSTGAFSTVTSIGQLNVLHPVVQIGAVGAGGGGAVRLMRDGGEVRWLAGILGSVGASSYSLFDLIRNAEVFSANITGNVTIAAPSSGIALSATASSAVTTVAQFNGSAGNAGYLILRGFQTGANFNGGLIITDSVGAGQVQYTGTADGGAIIVSGGSQRVLIGPAGNTTFNAPATGIGVSATGRGGATITFLASLGRTVCAADGEPYAVGAQYNLGGGAVFFGAVDGTATPGFQISGAGGNALLSGTINGNIASSGSMSAQQSLSVSSAAATERNVLWNTAGVVRWNLYANAAAESGANAGSDLALARYADNGVFLDNVFTVARATGAITINTASTGNRTVSINGTNSAPPLALLALAANSPSAEFFIAGVRKGIIGSVGGSGQLAFAATADDLVLRAVGKIRFSTDDGASSMALDAGAATRLIPGATSFVLSNNANNADNLRVTDAGALTMRSGATLKGLALDNDNTSASALGFQGIPQNSQSTAYTFVAADAGKHVLHPSADTTARTFTIPANGSVAYPIGTVLTVVNQNAAGIITLAITTDTMRLAGPGTTGSRTLAANGIATAVKVTATEWVVSGTGLT